MACVVFLALALGLAAKPKITPGPIESPRLEMDGGRWLEFDGGFSSERELKAKPRFWTRVVNIAIGEPVYHNLVRPYSVATDSHGRIIVTDPGSFGVHIFDWAAKKYKFLSRRGGQDTLEAPQCVAVDKQDNIYVTDSESGKIFVFASGGKLQRVIGGLKGGEGFFKRPTGIAVDSDARRIYVSDTWRDKVFVLDMEGSVLQTIGKKGQGDGEFLFPTELRLQGDELVVVDAMNSRVQFFNRAGAFRGAIGHAGDGRGATFRPKGIGVDSEGHYYVVDGLANVVQVFDRQGQLLYFFGKEAGLGDFALPAGLAIDREDRIYIVDTYHRRIEVFHYFGAGNHPERGTR